MKIEIEVPDSCIEFDVKATLSDGRSYSTTYMLSHYANGTSLVIADDLLYTEDY